MTCRNNLKHLASALILHQYKKKGILSTFHKGTSDNSSVRISRGGPLREPIPRPRGVLTQPPSRGAPVQTIHANPERPKGSSLPCTILQGSATTTYHRTAFFDLLGSSGGRFSLQVSMETGRGWRAAPPCALRGRRVNSGAGGTECKAKCGRCCFIVNKRIITRAMSVCVSLAVKNVIFSMGMSRSENFITGFTFAQKIRSKRWNM
ncbi:hypothetical protein CDAR_597101 [Caerostris darwini]|uniref:Uncharacterized protein n=1 Tax=Caerostris darwini TaxID=1538125 RepID=A0AAV4U2C9_9ARAC|nr:hypothetical protein CDAR_597101 [Caerostris darwini]